MPAALVLFLTLGCRHPPDCLQSDQVLFYADTDGDGHGDPDSTESACEQPDGFTTTSDDCDDTKAAVFPGAEEICDGIDNDCEGTTDENASDARNFYPDSDHDGFGAGDPILACATPDGYAGRPNDCDDTLPDVNPDAQEICDKLDNDCDGLTDDDDDDLVADDWYVDTDQDGYGDPATKVIACEKPPGYVGRGFDCDDTHDDANPEATEVCDGYDNDCDGLVDADDDPVELTPYYRDFDGDGYGNPDGKSILACDPPSGYVADNTDCLDNNAELHAMLKYYTDADGDGWGEDNDKPPVRCIPGASEVATTGDCDDADPAINPGMPELCASGDENCNGWEAEPDPTIILDEWYPDADGDGHGDPSAKPVGTCNPPDGYVISTGTVDDCDDTNPYIYPGALEVCDGIDNDCNKVVEDTDSVNWYADTDGDGYGNAGDLKNQCDQPTGYVRDDTDCDDGAVTTNPGSPDVCANGIDDDCDETIDNCIFDINDAGWVFQGDQLGQGLGLSIETGDFDGDGVRDDILMGSQWAEKDNGEIYVVNGPVTVNPFSSADAITLSPTLDRTYFGAFIGAGDANDDGVDDVLATPFLALDSFVFLGPITGDLDTSNADLAVGVLTPIDLEVAGDFDGDGASDIAFVADNTYILSGATSGSAVAVKDATYSFYGKAFMPVPDFPIMDVEPMGDANGDGITDLAMASTQATEGVIWIVYGGLAPGMYSADKNAEATIESSGEFASCMVTADYNHDGYVDLITDAPEVSESVTHDHFGAVYGFSGTTLTGGASLTAADADTDWESAGGAGKQMTLGDFDGDGEVDLAMGNPYGEYAQGFVFVDFGPFDTGTVADSTLLSIPGNLNEWHGRSLGAVADWSGDGGDDLVIGAQALGATGIWGTDGNGGAYMVFSEDLYATP